MTMYNKYNKSAQYSTRDTTGCTWTRRITALENVAWYYRWMWFNSTKLAILGWLSLCTPLSRWYLVLWRAQCSEWPSMTATVGCPVTSVWNWVEFRIQRRIGELSIPTNTLQIHYKYTTNDVFFIAPDLRQIEQYYYN